ncbi:Probable serine/threonine-protein kinase PknB [Mycobacteroides abscessus subsp. abscessus]|jgi:serine/threonine-protein kinase|nr:Probable serine/threonine-protein kinase PknB [Mycobacteroides abscessus subsp. abscessus]
MLIGKRLSGRYKVLEMIGGGGMANVYLAHDMILDRDVAVKVLRLDFSNDEEFIRRFHREAQSATSLAHPNIVSIYDVGEEDSIYYIVMEYVEGQTLKQYIQQQLSLHVADAINIMKQLTSAISHAHQNHIVHRDIKPHNILIDREGNVKITDFGIAMAMSATSITQTNSVLGSVHYLSPEQARGGMANRKSDIYSLGIVMFELLTGRLPFSGESAVSIALKHLQSETPSLRRWNPKIPQSVENIVLKATAKDPFHRYDSVEDMEMDLVTALDPDRIDEPKFALPIDDDATKAIPVITADQYQTFDETLVHSKEHPVLQHTTDKDGDKKNKKKRKWPIVLVSIFLILVILAVLTVTVLPKLLGPKDVLVPDVSGKELDEAMEVLQEQGLKIGETIEVTDEEVEEGLIIKTNPKEGKTVKEGQEVDLYLSIGKEKWTLLDYTGRQYDDVIDLLEARGFKDITKTEVYDDSAPVGQIISQNPSSGEEIIPAETELEFTVSKGPQLIKLKDLSDYNEKGIQEYAHSSGLNIQIASDGEYSDTVAEGLVVSQNPSAGTDLRKGSTVTVVLSKGKEAIPKTVQKEITIPYEPLVEGTPQVVQIYIEDMDHNISEPVQTFEITQTETRTIQLIIAPNQQGAYRVQRDGDVIDEQPVPYPTN